MKTKGSPAVFGIYFHKIIVTIILFATYSKEISSKDTIVPSASYLTTPRRLEQDGYDYETHTVTTEDGYILTAFRVLRQKSHSSNFKQVERRPVVFMMHGYSRSSFDYILLGPGKAHAYILVENGYDVWLGNIRGTIYSQTHVTKDPNFSDYWDFSFHEMGAYDLPTFVDYIRNNTGVEKVHYVGHSQACPVFLIACIVNQEFNKRIISSHLLGPAVFASNSLGITTGFPNILNEKLIEKFYGYYNAAPISNEKLNNFDCNKDFSSQTVCLADLSLFLGWGSPYIYRNILSDVILTNSVGSSSKQMLQFLQYARTGEFQQYDYGPERNLRIYNSIEPPSYDLNKVSVPTYLYNCDNDTLVSVPDFEYLSTVFPKNALKEHNLLPFSNCGHIDFLFGGKVSDYVIKKFLQIFRTYE